LAKLTNIITKSRSHYCSIVYEINFNQTPNHLSLKVGFDHITLQARPSGITLNIMLLEIIKIAVSAVIGGVTLTLIIRKTEADCPT
jgi:hypothetical protein